MEGKFYDRLKDLLKADPRFVGKETEILLKSEVINAALQLDKRLISDLLSVAEFKEKFFVKIKQALVFETNLFVSFIQDKNFLINSYTDFKNKIGLNIDGKYLKERGEVSLAFPFKDCVLAGGMTKEEQKRDEIFFNEILAQDEIDRLLAPKVFSNFKKFTASGESKIKDFQRDKNGTIKDNLIINGNNLLALHSLKQEFQGKVKLIYIDPPYNTGNDGFHYNDNFNHSAWLTFMKNRLEVARKLLRDDGVIFVQCDDNEQAYLKVLMDEVFNRDNFVVNFMWLHGKGKKDKNVRTLQEYALCYAKNKQLLETWKIVKKANYNFSNPDNDPRGKWFSGSISFSENRSNIHHENYFTIKSPSEIKWTRQWQRSEEEMKKLLEERKIYFGDTPDYQNVPRLKIFPDDEDNIIPPNIFENHGTTKSAKTELENLGFNLDNFDTPKPEKLMEAIINIATQQNDIVLDYHLGSGTSTAVAHKMGRQYIGIEQMDYVETITVERMKKVITGEQSGISKAANWQGGGEFIYFELKKYNQEAVEKLDKVESTEELLRIWQEMCERYFLNYDVDIKKFNNNTGDFSALPLIQQKKCLLEMLNKNQLYINLSEMGDSQFKLSEEDKSLTKKFYNK